MSTRSGAAPLSQLTSQQAKRSFVGFLNKDSTRAILSVRARMVSLMMDSDPDWEEFRQLSERLIGLCVATGLDVGAEVKGLVYLANQRGWGSSREKSPRVRDAGDAIPAKARVLEKKLRLAE